MRSRRFIVRAVVAIAIAAGPSCVDVKDGEQGVYGSPCGSSFHELLQCERETGGADPAAGGSTTDRAPTCANACTVLIGCRVPNPANINDCILDCEQSAPASLLLECIVDRGCDFQRCYRRDN